MSQLFERRSLTTAFHSSGMLCRCSWSVLHWSNGGCRVVTATLSSHSAVDEGSWRESWLCQAVTAVSAAKTTRSLGSWEWHEGTVRGRMGSEKQHVLEHVTFGFSTNFPRFFMIDASSCPTELATNMSPKTKDEKRLCGARFKGILAQNYPKFVFQTCLSSLSSHQPVFDWTGLRPWFLPIVSFYLQKKLPPTRSFAITLKKNAKMIFFDIFCVTPICLRCASSNNHRCADLPKQYDMI